MRRKVSLIQGQYLLGCLVGLWTIVEAWESLEVAVGMFYLDKKLMHQDPIGLLQRIVDVVLEAFSSIKLKHNL